MSAPILLKGQVLSFVQSPFSCDPAESVRIDEAADRLVSCLNRMLELAPEGELLRDGQVFCAKGSMPFPPDTPEEPPCDDSSS